MPNFLEDYEPVEDRLRAFWQDNPGGRVVTVLIEHADGHYIVRAEVFRSGDPYPTSSGLAEESKSDRGVNATSALENCETSAIGRALANLGYAAKGKRPSREEMSKASGAVAGKPPGSAQDPAPGTLSEEGRAATRRDDGVKSHSASGSPLSETSASSSGTTSVVNGEVAADTGTGGGVESSLSATPGSTIDAPGPPTFPKAPADCDHRGRSGNYLRWIKTRRGWCCPRCGTSKVAILEGTTADLGSA